MKNKYNNQQGFIAFTSLLVISAIVFAIAISVPILGVTEANNSLGFARSQAALKIAEGCNEEALIRLRDTVTYTGGTLSLGQGSCTISVSGTGSDRTINIQAELNTQPNFVRRTQTVVKRTGNSINIISWNEVN